MGTLRDELVEGLLNLSHAAQREIPKVGCDKLPTPWDRRHERINELIDELSLIDHLDSMAQHQPPVAP